MRPTVFGTNRTIALSFVVLGTTIPGIVFALRQLGATPLMMAVDAGQPKAVVLLLERGADLHSANYDGADAMQYAQGAPEKVRNELIAILNK